MIFQFIFQCTRKCDGGIRYRKVNCIGSKFCDLDLEPPNQESCNTHKCLTTTTTTAKTTTSFKTTTSATTTTKSPVLSSAAKMKESKYNIFDVPEFLPDINQKSSAMIEKQNVHENLMENESVMKNNNQAKDKIDQEINRQVEELKKMIDEHYKDATMDEMELSVFKHLQGIRKTVLEGYIEKKL